MFTTTAKVVAPLAVLVGLLLAPTASQAACDADYCFPPVTTDAKGHRSFTISPVLVGAIEEGAYKDCIWEVEAVYDDGSPSEDYTFDARKGLTASHTFPSPGEYKVHLYAAEGIHTESAGTCPSFHFIITAIFPEPPPPKEEPPVEPPKEEPPPDNGGGQPGGKTKKQGGGQQADEEAGGPGTGIVRWRQCKGDVYTRRVSCGKGRKVVKGALEKLARRGTTKVEGFSCRLRPSQARPLSCSRGQARILGPIG